MYATPSPDWDILLEPFQSLFSKPGFRYFCAFVRVLAHLDGRLWVTQVVLSRLLARHGTNFDRFLRSPAWDTNALARLARGNPGAAGLRLVPARLPARLPGKRRPRLCRPRRHRMIWALTGVGVTVLSTVELPESFTDLAFSSHAISFLTDDIIRLRYVEIEGQLRKILVVVKMRGGAHSKDIREYEITSEGMTIGARLKDYRGLITGVPEPLKPFASDTNEKIL